MKTLSEDDHIKFREYSLRLALENKLPHDETPQDIIVNCKIYEQYLISGELPKE